MNSILITLFSITFILFAQNGFAAQEASGREVIQGFYSVLQESIKNAANLGVKGRYSKLEKVITKSFDMPYMTRMAVGPAAWAKMSPETQQKVIEAFTRYSTATYVQRFDREAKLKFEVTDEVASSIGPLVKSQIVEANGTSHELDYPMHLASSGYQISDVYLTGSISQLATQRAQFTSILRNKGADGLIAVLNQKADSMLAQAE